MHLSEFVMALVVRALLWSVVILAPGGLILLPFLALRSMRKQRHDSSAPAH
jgi:hypothetical protein